MSVIISKNDVSGLNLYAVVFKKDTDQVLNVVSESFVTFSDSDIVFYAIPLTETRSGYYETDIQTYLVGQLELSIEIKQKVSGSYSYQNDFVKEVLQVYWNGFQEIFTKLPEKLEGPHYLGYYSNSQPIAANYKFLSNLGVETTGINNLYYSVISPSNVVIGTGLCPPVSYNAYHQQYILNYTPSGSLIAGQYRINVSGSVGGKLFSVLSFFNYVTGSLPFDILAPLGYVSAACNDASATSTAFVTTLPSTNNDHYNGQILRFTEGALMGQGRIVSDYNGITKQIILNKALGAAPVNGTRFVIFPIGGELNVS